MRSRDRLRVQPLGTSRRLALTSKFRSPGQRVAEMDYTGKAYHPDIHGWLTQLRNGHYVIEQVGGGIKNVDQRKAVAALEAMRRGEQDAETD